MLFRSMVQSEFYAAVFAVAWWETLDCIVIGWKWAVKNQRMMEGKT